MSPLDNPVLSSLSGPHAHFAEQKGQVLRYPVDVAPFLALPDEPDEHVWRDIADLAGPGATVVIAGEALTPPPGWTVHGGIPGVQLEGTNLSVAPEPEAVRLTEADVPEMLDLVERTRPGPFLRRTIALGTYLGIRRSGALIAMAGERFHPPDWTEISAVCTDPAFRGQGLAARLVRAVGAGIRDRGELPFLHAAASNVNAIRLYEALGFRLNRKLVFTAVEVPRD
ncbi:GNAT family N-acetyltransferase [Amycolatopsis sp. FDAARGOS 1241]|uniref:GNAT family N-acetyltransferase n=1 Tax=Amycolatopsis sp. FDAARGOS 1241 TaxID=2778070 RepID=UPI00195218F9|nr:GNAT family N-acetyltransferase [Amycolatopsis sp. FDAARGOS 1241]QRP47683.1 GNAT family N-acetyltransferase [Amycolatopsis sp. FDAARGOS 1241]